MLWHRLGSPGRPDMNRPLPGSFENPGSSGDQKLSGAPHTNSEVFPLACT